MTAEKTGGQGSEIPSAHREPGSTWRLLIHRASGEAEFRDDGLLDEVVLDDWFHLERMDRNLWWLRVGDARLLVELSDGGGSHLTIERDFYPPSR